MDTVELCAGGGGQALGLERAGFGHRALVEIDGHCRATLMLNRPHWIVVTDRQSDIGAFDGTAYRGVDLVAGGLPCPPFSVAGKQLGAGDDRNLFPDALRIVEEIRPRAVMIENVRGFLDAVFCDYRQGLRNDLRKLGFETQWRLFNASDFSVPQLRPRVVIVAIREDCRDAFDWPDPQHLRPATVGETLLDLMSSSGWPGAEAWHHRADDVAPTIVGGSKKHGGPDLGPTRSRKAWAAMGVDGRGLADHAPLPDFVGMPRLTVGMVARLQGFPDTWRFAGKKTASYRQVGNAFPPPVAEAIGRSLRAALSRRRLYRVASVG